MNAKEIGEIRRRQKRERSNMKTIYGRYVRKDHDPIDFERQLGPMAESEAEKYMSIFRRILGGAPADKPGKQLLEITFSTAQVAGSPEHTRLMNLLGDKMKEQDNRTDFFNTIQEHLAVDYDYVILLGTETYDVPFKNSRKKKGEEDAEDVRDTTFTYFLCAICPVKKTKPALQYAPADNNFQDGAVADAISIPELGIQFPAFDDRATNIYNALYFNRRAVNNYTELVEAVFNTPIDKPAAEQKEVFSEMVANTLESECSLEVLTAVQDEVRALMTLHEESKLPENLTLGKDDLCKVLEASGVSGDTLERFKDSFDKAYGEDAQMYPENIFNTKELQIETVDGNVKIRVAKDRGDLVETRVIGGVKYILVKADAGATLNGVKLSIEQAKSAK